MTAVELIRRMHRHMHESEEQLLQACRSLTQAQLEQALPIGQGSVWKSLIHLHGAQHAWYWVLQGDAARPLPMGIETWEQLEAMWRGTRANWSSFLASLTDQHLAQPVTRTNVRGTFTTPTLDVLFHLCDHSAYTSAQLLNMLRQLGVTQLPDRSVITWARRRYARGVAFG